MELSSGLTLGVRLNKDFGTTICLKWKGKSSTLLGFRRRVQAENQLGVCDADPGNRTLRTG